MSNISELTVMPAATAADAQVATGTPEEAADQGTCGDPQGPVETAARSVLLFKLSDADREFLHRQICPQAAIEIQRVLNFLRVILTAPVREHAARRIARQLAEERGTIGPRGESRPPRGCSWQRLYNKALEFERGCVRIERGREVEYSAGDWRIVWDKSKFPAPQSKSVTASAVPAAFVQFFRAHAENNQRGTERAYEEIIGYVWRTGFALSDIEVWDGDRRNGRVIKAGQRFAKMPGFPDWQPGAPIPAGLSLSNLRRRMGRMDRFDKAASRIGRQAASQFRRKVNLTRVGLAIGEFIPCDDHDFNVKIIQVGQEKFLRPSGFFGMDLLTFHTFAKGIKPTVWDEDAEAKRTLTESDFKFFLLHILTDFGRRTDERGTTFLLEHAKATVRDTEENREFLEGLEALGVKIDRSGREDRPAHVGQLPPATPGHGRGNFRFKPIEGWFNLLDNACAFMAGQTGKDRNFQPEQLPMIERECRELVRAAALLTPEDRARMQFPLLHWEDFFWQVHRLIDFIEHRDDHEIEGWEKCGFVTQPLLSLSGEIMVPARKCSPAEAFASRRSELKKLARWEWPGLLGRAHCYRANGEDTVLVNKDGVICIDNRGETGDSDRIFFEAVDYNGQRLKQGDRYRAYLNRYDLRALVLADEKNKPIAECPRIATPCRNDIDGVRRELGRTARWEANALREHNERHLAAGAEIARRREHNGNIIAGRTLADEPRRLSEEEELAALARAARMEEGK